MNIYLNAIKNLSYNNKYTTWYVNIINNALIRNWSKKDTNKTNTYCEKHHILPKSMGGDNNKENLVYLTAKEHFIVHHLLSKMPKLSNFKIKMCWAFFLMHVHNSTKRHITAKSFEKAKIMLSIIQKGKIISQETRNKMSKANLGKIRSPESKERMRQANLGEKNPMYNKEVSQETREKLSIAMSGENNPFFGKTHTEETRQKMSEIQKILQLGDKNGMFGKNHTEESRQKMSDNQPSDKTIYHFYHPEHGHVFSTQKELRKKYNTRAGGISELVHNKRKHSYGWSFIPD